MNTAELAGTISGMEKVATDTINMSQSPTGTWRVPKAPMSLGAKAGIGAGVIAAGLLARHVLKKRKARKLDIGKEASWLPDHPTLGRHKSNLDLPVKGGVTLRLPIYEKTPHKDIHKAFKSVGGSKMDANRFIESSGIKQEQQKAASDSMTHMPHIRPGMSIGAKAGVGAGVGAGVIAAGLTARHVLKKRKERKAQKAARAAG